MLHRLTHTGEPALYTIYYLVYLLEGHYSLIGSVLVGALMICHATALIQRS